ncbi:E3 ubiquitin-protein ligase RNF31 isoform X2 [Hydra vulgaris]|uniref:E3 ubiquitin-protein ligase RNF31 isoform X2 n=1 Tax=Hydra vulgaris TaxID=6087 RepID=UPI001F5E361B|nr:E3 ubiquitin-protein ligase RNF31 isoform X2 [Hydra vulgaris]
MDKPNFNLSGSKSLATDVKKPIPPLRPVPVPRPKKSVSIGNNDLCMSKNEFEDKNSSSQNFNLLLSKPLSNNLGFHINDKEIKEKINIDSNLKEMFSNVSSLNVLKSSEASQDNELYSAKPNFFLNDSFNNCLGNNKEFLSLNYEKFFDLSKEDSVIPFHDNAYVNKTLFENKIQLNKGRKELELLVKTYASSSDTRIVAEKLLNLDLSIASKYVVLDILCFLQSNKDTDITKIPTTFNLLEKYGMNLLKEESSRHHSWRIISTSSNLYKTSVGTVIGADIIIQSMGYTEKVKQVTGDLLVFPSGEKPNNVLVMNLVIDLLIAKYEIDFLLKHKHPYFEKLHMSGNIPDVYFTYVSNIFSTFVVEQHGSFVYQTPKSFQFASNSPLSQEIPSVSSNISAENFLCPKCSCLFIEQPKFCSNCGHQTQDNYHQIHSNNNRACDNLSVLDKQSIVKTELKQNHLKTTYLKQEYTKKMHLSFFEIGQTKKTEKFMVMQQWSCQYCTLLNDLSVLVCQACEQPFSDRKMFNKAQTVRSSNSDAKQITSKQTNLDNKQQTEIAFKQQHLLKGNRELITSTQKEIKKNTFDIVNIMQIAENEGFSVQLCEMALNCVEKKDWDSVCVWIKNQLPKLTNIFMEYSKQVFSQHEEIISEKEVHQFLYDFEVKVSSAFKAFQKKREKQILDLKSKFSVTEQVIHNVLFISEGDQIRAEELLQKKINGNEIRDLLKKTTEVTFKKLTDPNIPNEEKCQMIHRHYPKITWEKAKMCLKLINLNKYEVEDCLKAVKSNRFYNDCIQFLECNCCMCYNSYPRHKLTSNQHCQCQYCFGCYIEYLNVTITQNHIRNLVCANCQLPTEQVAHKSDYFKNLDNQILYFVRTNKLAPERHTLFQEKLHDFNLLSNPQFRWCAHCPSYGFIWESSEIKMRCNKCYHYTCFLCREKWLNQHNGISCERFKKWMLANDIELQTACAVDLLSKNKIECPKCRFKYILVCDGYMHFTCTQCGYEFCNSCFMGFFKGARCRFNSECANKGFHAHHTRDCYFYLRDKSVDELRTFLENNNIEFDKDRPVQRKPVNGPYRCIIPISEDNLYKPCGKISPDNMAGLCKKHYIEYLIVLVNNGNLDPVPILSIEELDVVLIRNYKVLLKKEENEVIEEFHKRLQEYVCKEIPLLKRK